MALVLVDGVVPIDRELFWEWERVCCGPTGMRPLEGFIQRNNILRNEINIVLPIMKEGLLRTCFWHKVEDLYDGVWTSFDGTNQPHNREELSDNATELVRFVGLVTIGARTGISGRASQPHDREKWGEWSYPIHPRRGGGGILRKAFWCSNLYYSSPCCVRHERIGIDSEV